MHVKICLLGQRKIGLFIVHYRTRGCRSHLKDNHTSCWRDYYPVARRWFHIWLAWAGSLDGDEKQSLSSQVFRPDFRSLIHFLRRHCQSLVGVRHISCELPPYALETALDIHTFQNTAYDKKSDEGSNSVRMRPENSGASKVVKKWLSTRVSESEDAQLSDYV